VHHKPSHILVNVVCARLNSGATRLHETQVLEIIADKLSASGWSWGCISAVDSEGRTIWIADAHRDEGKRFVVHADEKLTAFLELERAICLHLLTEQI
jgi:hypothetical protein